MRETLTLDKGHVVSVFRAILEQHLKWEADYRNKEAEAMAAGDIPAAHYWHVRALEDYAQVNTIVRLAGTVEIEQELEVTIAHMQLDDEIKASRPKYG